MKLIYNNTHSSVENNAEVINVIYSKVNEVIEQDGVVFSHLVIDGKEVYENHERYITEHLQEIIEVNIVTRSTSEMIFETMLEIHAYLERVVPSLNLLVDKSYENFSKETWDGIDQLGEGMQYILQFASVAENLQRKPSNWSGIEVSIKKCEVAFSQLLDAVKTRDTVLISDILSYEIVPAYECLTNDLWLALKDEEFIKNAN